VIQEYLPSLLALLAFCFPFAGSQAPVSGTVPFVFDGNRVYANLALVRPDGTLRRVLAFVDLGSPSTILSPALFQELQIDHHRGLTFQVGNLPVPVNSGAVTSEAWLPFSIGDNRRVEALLPAGVLQNYQVVFDYQHRTLTVAQPGTLTPAGSPTHFRINETTGLISIDISVNGREYPVTVDSGSAYTWLRKTTVQQWLEVHPGWQRGIGAVGESNMRMEDDGIEATGVVVRIPEVKLGTLAARQVGALAIGPSKSNWDFMDWYSKKNPSSVIGWLGGNVLSGFRITIDYPNRVMYWLPEDKPDPHDLDQVGLTLTSKNSEYYVAAVATQEGEPAVRGVQVGDKVVRIDALLASNATRGAVLCAMHGKPGDIRTLVLERDTRQLTVQAKIVAF
jgi:hypothetical protein